jgi:selenide,water dikinase
VLSDIPAQTDDRVLVDFRTADDAGVYRWEQGPALVQTVDFFTPIVDDPYIYGQIAAANALSDIYAMGGRPLTALAIAAFPKDDLAPGTIRDIFRGGFDTLREAGVSLLGGHTVQDPEIKFGYAVTGAIDAARVLTNAGAKPGDVFFLTKPLGTGIVGTAIKFDRAEPSLVEEAVRSMRTLNRAAAEALERLPPGAVHACTDVTGFGLIGHATEVARASGVTIVIESERVPVFAGVLAIAPRNQSGGLGSNQEHFSGGVRIEGAGRVDSEQRAADTGAPSMGIIPLLYDPQTSGGLLIAVDQRWADQAAEALRARGISASRIAAAEPARPGVHIVVRQ